MNWARQIKERDGKRCVICLSEEKPQAAHIIQKEGYPEFMYEIWNGVTLCVLHHKFSRQISSHNSSLAFYVWLAQYRPLQLEAAQAAIRTKLIEQGFIK